MFGREIKEQIIEAGKRLYEKGFVASNDGNISARVDKDAILITPTGICKGGLTTEQILKVDLNGKVYRGFETDLGDEDASCGISDKTARKGDCACASPPQGNGVCGGWTAA